jgi:hypothetical protein
MFLNFQAVIAALGAGAVFRIANEARPAGDYLFNTILPERNMWTYNVDSGSMEIRPTMAGMVGMDSPYPPGGIVSVTTFLEQTAKLANEIGLNEATLRQMQQMMQQLAINAQPTTESLERRAAGRTTTAARRRSSGRTSSTSVARSRVACARSSRIPTRSIWPGTTRTTRWSWSARATDRSRSAA